MFEKLINCKIEYKIDNSGQEIMLRDNKDQVMMEWEKFWMESCIDELTPHGDVLEIGFGLGLSATQFQKYKINSHTIIECHPTAIKKTTDWAKKYKNIKIIEETWQESLNKLNKYDCIFFDDYSGLFADEKYTQLEIYQDQIRFKIFINKCFDYFMKVGAKACVFMNKSKSNKERYNHLLEHRSDIKYYEKWIDINPPDNCKYYKENKALIPIFEKIN